MTEPAPEEVSIAKSIPTVAGGVASDIPKLRVTS